MTLMSVALIQLSERTNSHLVKVSSTVINSADSVCKLFAHKPAPTTVLVCLVSRYLDIDQNPPGRYFRREEEQVNWICFN